MWPTKQDVRTHKSVRAKTAKQRSTVTLDSLLAIKKAIFKDASKLYRAGNTRFSVVVEIPRNDIEPWGVSEELLEGHERYISSMENDFINHLNRRLRIQLRSELAKGVFISDVIIRKTPFNDFECVVKFSVVNPQPEE